VLLLCLADCAVKLALLPKLGGEQAQNESRSSTGSGLQAVISSSSSASVKQTTLHTPGFASVGTVPFATRVGKSPLRQPELDRAWAGRQARWRLRWHPDGLKLGRR
jgi:hypothetical protein